MACSSCKKPTFEMFTVEEEVNITIVLEGNTSKSYSGIRDKQARDDSTIVPLGHWAIGPGPLIGKTPL